MIRCEDRYSSFRQLLCFIWLFHLCTHILYSAYIFISLVTTVILGCVLRGSLYLHYSRGSHRFGIRPPKQPTGIYIVPSPLFFIKWLHPSQGGDRVGSSLVAERGFSQALPVGNISVGLSAPAVYHLTADQLR